jgi:hypothetical protein
VADIPNRCRRYPLDALSIALAFGLAAAPALAQLQLPGALGQPAPAGTVAPPPEAPKERPKPPILHAPSEDAVVGRTLLRNGSTGTLVIERAGKDLRVQKLALTGDQISKPNEHCRVEVSGMPLPLASEEDVHGFCALRVTEARAIALGARLAGVEDVKPKPPKPKPKPAAPPEAAVQEPLRQ